MLKNSVKKQQEMLSENQKREEKTSKKKCLKNTCLIVSKIPAGRKRQNGRVWELCISVI